MHEKRHPCVCISSAFLFHKVSGRGTCGAELACRVSQVGASSAQVEFASMSALLSLLANLCTHTARVRKAGLKMKLDKVFFSYGKPTLLSSAFSKIVLPPLDSVAVLVNVAVKSYEKEALTEDPV